MNHEYYMNIALEEARKARDVDELPIGCALVGGDELVAKGQTSVLRDGSIVAHGEIKTLYQAGKNIYTCKRPLVLYTTLEPCLMCLGAAIQCGVDIIVYGMRCNVDGALNSKNDLKLEGQNIPNVIEGILEAECVEVFKTWDKSNTHPAYSYVNEILEYYKTNR